MKLLPRSLVLVLLSVLLVASPLDAQSKRRKKKAPPAKTAPKVETPDPPTPAKVELVQVNDRRSSGHFANLMVHIVLPDVQENEVMAESVVPKTAKDDTGKDLLQGATERSGLSPTSAGMGFGSKNGEAPSPTRLTISLASPARGAASIKEITGEIELYMPGRDPNATAKVDKILDHVGKTLVHPALAANEVEITLLTKAQLDTEKKRLADKKRLDMKKDGLSGESLEDAVKSFLEMLVAPEEGEIVARVKDPKKRIQGYSYVTPSGELKRVVGMDRDGFTVFSSWSGKPQPDWSLKIELTTPKTLVRHTFMLADVKLP